MPRLINGFSGGTRDILAAPCHDHESGIPNTPPASQTLSDTSHESFWARTLSWVTKRRDFETKSPSADENMPLELISRAW